MFVSSSHDQHAHIWKFDGATGEIKLLYVCKGHSRIIEAITVSPDGEKVSIINNLLNQFDKL